MTTDTQQEGGELPTPRTDAKVLLWNLSSRELEESYSHQRLGVDGRDINGKLVPADFARTLERDLIAMTAESQRNREAGQMWASQSALLTQQVKELREGLGLDRGRD